MHRAIVVGLLFSLTGARAQGPAGDLDLTPEEHRLVLDLAQQALKDKNLLKGKMVLTSLEVLRNTKDRESPRNALLIHYRYDGNLAIFTSVNIGRRAVTKVETEAHFPTSLAPEEVARAIELAHASADLRKALAKYGPPEKLEVDPLVAHTADPQSPVYGHRAVRLFYRQGRTYLLYGPTVLVDLTTETVRVSAGGDDGHK
jgi:hypothetical protein